MTTVDFIIHLFCMVDDEMDGRIRKWTKVKELSKFLRVILLEDEETVHNAFFDRDFKEGQK